MSAKSHVLSIVPQQGRSTPGGCARPGQRHRRADPCKLGGVSRGRPVGPCSVQLFQRQIRQIMGQTRPR